MKLGRDVFLALSAVVWADGEVADEEHAALLRAARAAKLEEPDLAAIERALATPVPIATIAELTLAPRERDLVYAIALWLARADGIVQLSEAGALATLATILGLPEDEGIRNAAAAVAIEKLAAAYDGEDPLGALADEIARHADDEVLQEI
jgi:uncharacterized membrane protein YebE (DUF533 family)